jgi:hypothetical protein
MEKFALLREEIEKEDLTVEVVEVVEEITPNNQINNPKYAPLPVEKKDWSGPWRIVVEPMKLVNEKEEYYIVDTHWVQGHHMMYPVNPNNREAAETILAALQKEWNEIPSQVITQKENKFASKISFLR